mmetsp:Transcript_19039/g.21925  ORF Transcript_19039/g.21925 Transcript_19039/m.21925 type:complete len:137 (-) Transcript_19039:323-733(-)
MINVEDVPLVTCCDTAVDNWRLVYNPTFSVQSQHGSAGSQARGILRVPSVALSPAYQLDCASEAMRYEKDAVLDSLLVFVGGGREGLSIARLPSRQAREGLLQAGVRCCMVRESCTPLSSISDKVEKSSSDIRTVL